MGRTPEEIRRRGLSALRKALGQDGMIRFLQQFDPGSGNYAQERHAWVDQTSLEDLIAAIAKKRSKKK